MRKRMLQEGFSVVIPVFNSKGSLALLVERICTVLKTLEKPYEIILINDGSRDASWPAIVDLADRIPVIQAVNLMRNYGQHNALLAGTRLAQYKITITLDDDLQHPPEEIPKLISRIREGYDVVYGSPREQKHSISRNLASRITRLALMSVMNTKIARRVSAFRAFRTQLRAAFADYNAPRPSLDVLLSWATNKFSYLEVRHEERKEGKSQYTFLKLFNHAIAMATGYSTMPLRLASLIGFGFTLFGILILGYVLIQYLLHGSPVAGFPFLASTIAIFSGVQLFALGIIGEYLAQMYTRLMDKPAYVIQEIRNSADRQTALSEKPAIKLKPEEGKGSSIE